MTISRAIAALSVNLSGPLREATTDIADQLRARLQVYPPPPPKAKRTGRLRQGWMIQPTTRGATVLNTVPYAPYVQSARRQTRFARALGWTTDFQAVQEVLSGSGAATAVKAALGKAFRR